MEENLIIDKFAFMTRETVLIGLAPCLSFHSDGVSSEESTEIACLNYSFSQMRACYNLNSMDINPDIISRVIFQGAVATEAH